MNIGFLYNLYHQDSSNHPDFYLEIDADDTNTIDAMTHYLSKNHKVFPIEADENAYAKLKRLKNKLDLVFNYSIGIYGEDRYAHFPSILEMLRIPYSGSGPLTHALVLNKAKMGELLSVYGVSSPKTIVIRDISDLKNIKIDFPAIVKPESQGSSAGITVNSIVSDGKSLARQVRYVLETFKQPALVQSFIEGREITVSMLGNPPKILPPAEFDFRKMPKGNRAFLPYEWDVGNFGPDFLVVPAKIDDELYTNIKKTVRTVWDALKIKDYCRIDLRINKSNEIFVLDVNSPPSLVPPEIVRNDPFPSSAKASGMDYGEMLEKIIVVAFERYKIAKGGKIV